MYLSEDSFQDSSLIRNSYTERLSSLFNREIESGSLLSKFRDENYRYQKNTAKQVDFRRYVSFLIDTWLTHKGMHDAEYMITGEHLMRLLLPLLEKLLEEVRQDCDKWHKKLACFEYERANSIIHRRDIGRAVVSIEADKHVGTGFLVSSGNRLFAVTCAHVVKASSRVRVRLLSRGSELYQFVGEVCQIDGDLDIAVISFDQHINGNIIDCLPLPGEFLVELSEIHLRNKEKVLVCPLSHENLDVIYQPGTIKVENREKLIDLDCGEPEQGWSGSPVLYELTSDSFFLGGILLKRGYEYMGQGKDVRGGIMRPVGQFIDFLITATRG